MEILSIIPARGGSKGIPGKNIKMLAGKPLVAHTIQASLNSKYITKTVVSTEDTKIRDVAVSFGAQVVDRPSELAQDETMTAPVLLHVLDELEKTGYVPDIVVLLQATCPLRTEKEIDEAFSLFFESDCDSVFSVHNAGLTHALWRKEHNGQYKALYDYRTRPRRQDNHRHYSLYCENGSIYIVKTPVMRQVGDFIGHNPEIYLMYNSVDIDEPEDFKRVEELIEKRNLNPVI